MTISIAVISICVVAVIVLISLSNFFNSQARSYLPSSVEKYDSFSNASMLMDILMIVVGVSCFVFTLVSTIIIKKKCPDYTDKRYFYLKKLGKQNTGM